MLSMGIIEKDNDNSDEKLNHEIEMETLCNLFDQDEESKGKKLERKGISNRFSFT